MWTRWGWFAGSVLTLAAACGGDTTESPADQPADTTGGAGGEAEEPDGPDFHGVPLDAPLADLSADQLEALCAATADAVAEAVPAGAGPDEVACNMLGVASVVRGVTPSLAALDELAALRDQCDDAVAACLAGEVGLPPSPAGGAGPRAGDKATGGSWPGGAQGGAAPAGGAPTVGPGGFELPPLSADEICGMIASAGAPECDALVGDYVDCTSGLAALSGVTCATLEDTIALLTVAPALLAASSACPTLAESCGVSVGGGGPF